MNTYGYNDDFKIIDKDSLAFVVYQIRQALTGSYADLRNRHDWKTITISEDSSITEEKTGKLDISSVFSGSTDNFYRVLGYNSMYNGILYYGTEPFKNVIDNSLVRVQKNAIIY